MGTTRKLTIICRQLFTSHVVGSWPMERKKIMRRMIKSNASAHPYWAHEFICHVMHESAKNNEMKNDRTHHFLHRLFTFSKRGKNLSTRSLIFSFCKMHYGILCDGFKCLLKGQVLGNDSEKFFQT